MCAGNHGFGSRSVLVLQEQHRNAQKLADSDLLYRLWIGSVVAALGEFASVLFNPDATPFPVRQLLVDVHSKALVGFSILGICVAHAAHFRSP